jgi:hypothetical protein
MAKHVWTVLCAQSLTDLESNQISLINVIEQLTISDAPPRKKTKDLPVVQLEAQLVSMWTRIDPEVPEPETISVRIKYVTESGIETICGTNSFDLSKNARMRHVIRFNSVPVSGPGLHTFVVQSQTTGANNKKVKWVTHVRVPLAVVFSEPGNLSASV